MLYLSKFYGAKWYDLDDPISRQAGLTHRIYRVSLLSKVTCGTKTLVLIWPDPKTIKDHRKTLENHVYMFLCMCEPRDHSRGALVQPHEGSRIRSPSTCGVTWAIVRGYPDRLGLEASTCQSPDLKKKGGFLPLRMKSLLEWGIFIHANYITSFWPKID